MFNPPPSRRTHRQDGFALLITITLLAFLVLLLVSLASLTRVETQVATNTRQLSQARGHALMALNLALGQLQTAGGADQRATARADLGDAANAGGASGLVVPKDGTRHWTGVWANADTPAHLYAQRPSPRLLTWLVSGNEKGPAFAADITGKLTTVPAPADIPFAPDDVTGSVSGATALSSSATFPGNRASQLLVGPGTAVAAADYVAAPKMDISADNIPGVGTALVGRYAWWVGDEGVKAKYNLPDSYHGNLDTNSAEGRYRASVAQRGGIELLNGLSGYPAGSASLANIRESAQIPLADSAATAAVTASRYHDITTHSFGVLSDALSGGLKRDLTFHLEKGGLSGKIVPAPPAATPNDWYNLWNQMLGPRWEILRSFHQLADSPGSVDSRPIAQARHTDSGTPVYGVFPVVVQVRFFATLHVGDAGDMHVRIRPMVILGNPYTRPITLNGFDYYLGNAGGMRMRLYLDGANPPKLDRTIIQCLPGALFRCGDSITFAPGELKTFTLGASLTINGASPGTSEPVLAEGVDPSTYIDYVATPTVTAAEKSKRWTMLVSDGGQMSFNFCMQGSAHSAGTRYLQITETGVLGESFIEQRAYDQIPVDQTDGFLTQDWGGVIMALRSSTTAATGGTPRERLRPYADLNIRTSSPARPWFHANNAGGLEDNPLYSGGYYAAPSIWSANAAFPSWNLHVITDPSVTPQDRLVLFDLPRRSSPSEPAIMSVGYLRHADLTADSVNITHPCQPGSAVGNSLASPVVPRDRAAMFRTYSPGRSGNVFDASYILNTALWDRYFFSTIPQNSGASFSPATDRLPNARLRFNAGTSPALTDLQNQEANGGINRAARHLLVDGAFNVNSTSVEAWTALLGGLTGLTVNGEAGLEGPFPRSLLQPEQSADAGTGTAASSYAGFRNISKTQLRRLADEMVGQVRARGPFLSLAQFVNRSLESGPLGLKGAVQTAIDASGLNGGFPGAEEIGATSDLPVYADPEAGRGATGAGLPGWLTQADVLEALAPSLSARSDTFVIRTYGESVNPATQVVDSRAWCEAVVQRLPDYVSPAATGSAAGDPATADPAALQNNDNKTFGRRFVVVGFRWLTPADI